MDDTIMHLSGNHESSASPSSRTLQDAGDDVEIETWARRVATLLACRDELHSRTPIEVDFIESGPPREWSEHDTLLDEALTQLSWRAARTQADLRRKFRCLDLLLDTFEADDRRVVAVREALLKDCRHFADSPGSPKDTRAQVSSNGRPGAFPSLLRVFSKPDGVTSRPRSRRSHV